MNDFIKVGNGIYVNLMTRMGYVPMTIPFGASYSIKPPTPETIAQMKAVSLGARTDLNLEIGTGPAVNPEPQDSDYIYPLFRALDAGLIEDYWIDFSLDGVLKKSMPAFVEAGNPLVLLLA